MKPLLRLACRALGVALLLPAPAVAQSSQMKNWVLSTTRRK
ncbi:hypothetical protein [Hymenobacter sp. BT18]|nr:hypothetical protein [Hymenobacter sp. BT18]